MPPILQEATTNPCLCQRLPDTHRQIQTVSCGVTFPFSWVLSCPPRAYFPVLCKFWQLHGGVNGDLLQDTFCHTQVCCTQSPFPCGRPLLISTCAGDTQTLKSRFGSVPVGFPAVQKVLFMPSECLWSVWGLILNAISPLLPSCWSFSFAYGCGVSFFGGIQHSLVDGCSAASCNFGALAEDECTSFSAILL